MTSLTYDSKKKTFNADIAINQADSESTLNRGQDFGVDYPKINSQSENELADKKTMLDPHLVQDLYKDSIIEEADEKTVTESDKALKKYRDHTDSSINIKLNLIKNNSQPIETNFFLHKGQNNLLNHKCDLIPNASFDVNRTFTDSDDDENTYVSVDVYKKTIKKTDSKMAQSEKPIGQLKLKLEPHMKEKSSSSLDHHDSSITFTTYRKRLI